MEGIKISESPTAGYDTYIQFGWETTWGTEAGTIDKVFGRDVILLPTPVNEYEKVFGAGSRNASAAIAKMFKGTLTVEFKLSNPYFTRAILGAAPTDAGGGPYTHTYIESNTLTPITIEDGTDLDTDVVRKYLGVVVDQATFNLEMGKGVGIKLSCMYKTEAATAVLDGTPATGSEDILQFWGGSIQLPSGTTLARVQSGDLTIKNSVEMIPDRGTRLAGAYTVGERHYDFNFNYTFESSYLLEKFYGSSGGPVTAASPASDATLILTFTNGGASTALRSYVVTLATVYLNKDDIMKDGEIHKQDVEGFALSCTNIVGTDNTANAP